ncbi:MAG TPA: zf-HC2 domain-containing protein [Rhodothermia bacterium]|nr:zf-HC2 domain-containing protein [Rhodothermia bacterium]
MDCREFHDKHFAFIDDTLSGIELVGVQRHIAECEKCAKHDAIVRRSLLLFRNLPRIEPSADFAEKLNARIRQLKETESFPFHHSRAFAATIAISSMLMLGYIGSSLRDVDAPRDIVFPPVVASLPEAEMAPISTPAPALVASVPAGLPIWTAALYAELAPIHFASADLQFASSGR